MGFFVMSNRTDKLGTEKDWIKICLDGMSVSIFSFCATTLEFYWAVVAEKVNSCLHSFCCTQMFFLITGWFARPVSCESVMCTVAIRQK